MHTLLVRYTLRILCAYSAHTLQTAHQPCRDRSQPTVPDTICEKHMSNTEFLTCLLTVFKRVLAQDSTCWCYVKQLHA